MGDTLNETKRLFQHLLMAVLILFIAVAGQKTYLAAVDYEDRMAQYSASQNIKDLTKTSIKRKFDWRSWFKSEDNATKNAEVEELPSAPVQSHAPVVVFSLMVSLVLLGWFFLPLRTFNVYASLSLVIVLCYALVTPLMMVTIHKDIAYIGDVVLSFESKSVVSSVVKLFNGGDYVLSLAIALFSVFIPVLKVASLFLVAVFQDTFFTHRLIGFFKVVGKWSMVDVFVVAVLLVFLSANNGDISRAEVEMGVYVFMVYVIASMVVSLTASEMLAGMKYEK